MSDWGDPMTQHAMSDWASHLAEPSAKVLTSFSLLKKYEEDAVKVGGWNVQIQMEDLETRELEKKGQCRIRPDSPPRGPGPHTCPSCGARPWKPLHNALCDSCGLRAALEKSWKSSGCAMLQDGSQTNKKENADSDDNDDDAPKPAMSNRARKCNRGGAQQPPRQCPKCKKRTWEHMPLGWCDRCGMTEAMSKSWIACQRKRNGSTNHASARQQLLPSSWQAPQAMELWSYEPPPETSASSSSQAPSAMIRATSRHNKISSTPE